MTAVGKLEKHKNINCLKEQTKISKRTRAKDRAMDLETAIEPMQKGVSLFLSYTNMNKMNSLHHMKEHSKISNFLQFESHSSKCDKDRAKDSQVQR